MIKLILLDESSDLGCPAIVHVPHAVDGGSSTAAAVGLVAGIVVAAVNGPA